MKRDRKTCEGSENNMTMVNSAVVNVEIGEEDAYEEEEEVTLY